MIFCHSSALSWIRQYSSNIFFLVKRHCRSEEQIFISWPVRNCLIAINCLWTYTNLWLHLVIISSVSYHDQNWPLWSHWTAPQYVGILTIPILSAKNASFVTLESQDTPKSVLYFYLNTYYHLHWFGAVEIVHGLVVVACTAGCVGGFSGGRVGFGAQYIFFV